MFIGVNTRCCTHRHLAEYIFINDVVNGAKGNDKYEEYKSQISAYGKPGLWITVPLEQIHDIMVEKGVLHTGKCGEADVHLMSCKEYMAAMFSLMREYDPRFYDSKKSQGIKAIIEEIEANKKA